MNIESMLEWLDELKIGEKDQVEMPETEDGCLALLDGKLLMKKPSRGGKWPTIVTGPDRHVQVLYHGKMVEQPLVLETTQGIAFRLFHRPAKSEFRLEVSSDKMEVWLETEFEEGIEYRVADSDYVPDLVVVSREKRRHAPKPIDPQRVLDELEKMGVKMGADAETLESACQSGENSRVLIVRGIKPEPPVDGRIEALHDLTGTRVREEQGDRVDWFDRGKIDCVEPGEVLAFWHPPVEGKPGWNVFGERVDPRQPKWARFTAGRGVKLVEDGTIAVAEIAGRPTIEWGQICVKPELVIDSDVDIATGNIDFTGDVLVMGSVREGLEVKAGGLVTIGHNSYHADIRAGSSVDVRRNVIGGRVSAGGDMIVTIKMAALLKRIIPLLRQLQTLTLQIKTHTGFAGEEQNGSGDGHLIKAVLETKLPSIPELFADVLELLPRTEELELDREQDRIWNILHHIARRYQGANPLRIQSIREVQTSEKALSKVVAFLEDVLSAPADIKLSYAQNAELEATGDIIVNGLLVYACRMSAGQRIRIAGSCRNGRYFAGSSIAVRYAGLNETVRTSLAVDEGGFIAAETFYPGVRIQIGHAKMTIRELRKNVIFRFEDGKWSEEYFSWGSV